MKLLRTLTPHGSEPGLEEEESTDIVTYPEDHPVVKYLNADASVLWVQILVEDGTLIKFAPLERT
jgi:hypothetical protein